MNSEEQYIEMESARIDASDQYFSARPQIDGLDRRRVFETGFDRGWKAALKSQAKSGPAEDGAIDKARFEKAPCYLCGYNGPGYYQPDTHPCAAKYHTDQHQKPTS